MQLGAIDINSHEYVLPTNAIKENEYICFSCNDRVILKKGSIRIPHFAHVFTNCRVYDYPTETAIHKHSKLFLHNWLINRKPIKIVSNNIIYTSEMIYHDEITVETEYRSKDGLYIADVAILMNNIPIFIFEIKNTHQTETHRPEPWFEFTVDQIIDKDDKKCLELNCIRNEPCTCYECFTKLSVYWLYNTIKLVTVHGKCSKCNNIWIHYNLDSIKTINIDILNNVLKCDNYMFIIYNDNIEDDKDDVINTYFTNINNLMKSNHGICIQQTDIYKYYSSEFDGNIWIKESDWIKKCRYCDSLQKKCLIIDD